MNDIASYRATGLLADTIGSLIFHHLRVPAPDIVQAQHRVPRTIILCKWTTPDTQQSSVVKVGLLREHVSTLISDAAKAAVGPTGLKRLENFLRLGGGWDGKTSMPLGLKSVAVFSEFFASTGLRPARLGVFMSAQGNVVVNWCDKDGRLVELEFGSSCVDFFIESTGEEDSVPTGDIGFTKLFSRVAGRV